MAQASKVRADTGLGLTDRYYRPRTFDTFSLTASRINAANAASLTTSSSRTSMARVVLLSSLALKSFFGSAIRAPLGKVNLTEFLSASPMQTIPSRDQTGTPAGLLGFFHFTSSSTEEDARLIKARSSASVAPMIGTLKAALTSARTLDDGQAGQQSKTDQQISFRNR